MLTREDQCRLRGSLATNSSTLKDAGMGARSAAASCGAAGPALEGTGARAKRASAGAAVVEGTGRGMPSCILA